MTMDANNQGRQQLRPQWERDLPEWGRAALDEQRRQQAKYDAENPGIRETLARIERKIDKLLAQSETSG